MEQDGNTVGHCSGVYLGEGKVLTAGHCNREDTEVFIKTYNSDELHKAEWIKDRWNRGDGIPVSDLGLLKTKDLPIPVATVACDRLSVGTKVYAVGHPRNLLWTVTEGTVTTLVPRHKSVDGHWIQMDLTIDRGNSGGPVFDRFGNLVGIISHSMIAGRGRMSVINSPHSYAVSPDKVCGFINVE
jgi:S1-C subfamily serine protease